MPRRILQTANLLSISLDFAARFAEMCCASNEVKPG